VAFTSYNTKPCECGEDCQRVVAYLRVRDRYLHKVCKDRIRDRQRVGRESHGAMKYEDPGWIEAMFTAAKAQLQYERRMGLR
jgi:hypothetical protein